MTFIPPPYEVWATSDDGDVRVWLCDTARQANQLRDGIQDDIMRSASPYSAAWVHYTGDSQ